MGFYYLVGTIQPCGIDMLLPIALVIQFILFPSFPPILIGYFESETACLAAVAYIAERTREPLILTCVVST